jgi:hypothetical protein
MAYTYIDPTRYDAESPITESLMTDIIENITSNAVGGSYTSLTGSGTYSVPTGITKLKVIMVSGGHGGLSAGATNGGIGGMAGAVRSLVVTTTGGSSLSYSCGSGGATDVVGGATTFDGNSVVDNDISITNQNFQPNYGTINGLGGIGASNGADSTPGSMPHFGALATGGALNGGNGGGGAGASMALPYSVDYSMPVGGNGGTNGSTGGTGGIGSGGGGGGAPSGAGGAGGAGIIFVLPVG